MERDGGARSKKTLSLTYQKQRLKTLEDYDSALAGKNIIVFEDLPRLDLTCDQKSPTSPIRARKHPARCPFI